MTFVGYCQMLLQTYLPPIGASGIDPRLHHCLKDMDVHFLGDLEVLRKPVRRHPFSIA